MDHININYILPKKICFDILYPKTLVILPSKQSYICYLTNAYTYILIKLNKLFINSFTEYTKNIRLYVFITEYITNSNIDNKLKIHLNTNTISYIFILIGTIFNDQSFKCAVTDIINSDRNLYNGLTEKYTDIGNKYSYKVIVNILNNIRFNIKSALIAEENTVENINDYRTMTYKELIASFTWIYLNWKYINESSLSTKILSLGLMPPHWINIFKMRISFFSQYKGFPLIINMIDATYKRYSSLYSVQYSKRPPNFSIYDTSVLLRSIPLVEHKQIIGNKCLNSMTADIYKDIDATQLRYTSTLQLAPKSPCVLLKQYVVMYLANWEQIWKSERWPISIQLTKNIRLYKLKHDQPDFKLIIKLIFNPYIQL
jgi:hypothetical protein